jgi:hypothetical protein
VAARCTFPARPSIINPNRSFTSITFCLACMINAHQSSPNPPFFDHRSDFGRV